jgi:DNA-binding MarR family transcriptional regulator
MPRTASAAKIPVDSAEADQLGDGGLEDLLGFHVRLANVAMYRDFASTLDKLDLTQRQAATLSLIGANPGAPQVAIAARLGSDRATIMAMVDRLEGRGLLTRERSKSDRRRQELYLTPLGQKTLKEAKALIAEHEQRFTALFSKEELAVLFESLKRIHR